MNDRNVIYLRTGYSTNDEDESNFNMNQDTGAIFRGEHTREKKLERFLNILKLIDKEGLNMSKCAENIERWSIGDRIAGVCMCTPSKRVVLEVVNINDYVWFKDTTKDQEIVCGLKIGEPLSKQIFVNGYNKYTYTRLPKDVWQVGDILRGECRCDESKTIDFEYLGSTSFRDTADGCIQYGNFSGDHSPQNIVSVFSTQYKSDYTNWRRVPKYTEFWTKEREDAIKLHGSSSIDASMIEAGSATVRTPVDYEFGDCIKIRGFEYQIPDGASTQDCIVLKKKEPPKCPTCGREYRD